MAIANGGMRLEFDQETGKATISGLTAATLGAATPEDLQPIIAALAALTERLNSIERTAITRSSYTLEIVPGQ
jgi:hypothetical protein